MLRFLLTREVAQDPPSTLRRAQNTRATYSLSPSPSFSLKTRHYGAVNALAVEKVENRYLLSAGADAIINLWDLEASSGGVVDTLSTASLPTTATPSSVKWWTGDTGMFSTTHHDHSLLIWDTNTFSTAARFPLGPEAPIRTHAPSAHGGVNPVIAVALGSPGVRLVDLRTSSAAHTLTSPYSRSGTLDVAWSPRSPHHIASTHDDGSLRLWDIRRASPLLHTTRAHSSGATGVEWTSDGGQVVTAGWDGKMRVWDVEQGRDCVVNFGPWITN
ncbi:DNA excision repair protein ERCC-8, partial [Saitoella complicata NRRL Y-17804]